MNVAHRLRIVLVLGIWFASHSVAQCQEKKADNPTLWALTKEAAAARQKGLDWLTKNQAEDGSWGKDEKPILVTGMACLAYLAAADEPFVDERGKALVKGLNYLIAKQKDGVFDDPQEASWWTYKQAFATLALSEAYGRSLVCKVKPDMDMQKVHKVLGTTVQAIEKHQSADGDWPYTQHCVQAIVSASNHGIKVDEQMLARGFEHLRKCQNKDGGFSLNLGDGRTLNECTCGALATLGLMQKFDFTVMINGYQSLLKVTPAKISAGHCPYYGHFYGTIGMHLLAQEYKEVKEYRTQAAAYAKGARDDLLSWQQADGTWPTKNESGMTTPNYATAYAVMTLSIAENRLTIFRRTLPK